MSDIYEITNGDVRIRIEGMRKMIRKLEKAGADAQDMKDLMHSIGMLVVNAAAPPHKSGKLAGSMRAGRGKTKAVVRAGGAAVPYAGVIHYGHPSRNIRAQPFFTSALQAKQGEAFTMLENGIDEILEKADLK